LKFLLTLFAFVIIAAAAAVGFIYSGIYEVSAMQPDHPIVAWALHTASDRSVAARLKDIQEPTDLDSPAVVEAGARLFGQHCAVCHGGPGLKATAIAQGLNPPPPNLFRAGRKPHTTEIFWFVKNGVNMTGMPSFGKTHPDTDIWAVTAFLRKAPGMSAEEFARLGGANAAAQSMQ
jgi:mono/diheme cytochrome c family protein